MKHRPLAFAAAVLLFASPGVAQDAPAPADSAPADPAAPDSAGDDAPAPDSAGDDAANDAASDDPPVPPPPPKDSRTARHARSAGVQPPASAATAEQTEQAGPGYHTHDGFFLRLSTGLGIADVTHEEDGLTESFSGQGADINIAIGGIITENVALHATLGGWSIIQPEAEVTMASGETDTQQTDSNDTMTMTTIGLGVTVYLPYNAYVSGSGSMATMTLADGDTNQQLTSDDGFAIDLTLGKEWWVSANWGLGAALGLGYQSIPPQFETNDGYRIGEAATEDFVGTSVGLRFSATYN